MIDNKRVTLTAFATLAMFLDNKIGSKIQNLGTFQMLPKSGCLFTSKGSVTKSSVLETFEVQGSLEKNVSRLR